MKAFEFIPPTEPVLAETPPSATGWCHEVKWDGFRLQLHKVGDRTLALSKNGKDLSSRFRDIVQAVAGLPCRTCIIDAEGCALDAEGKPDFRALVGGQKHKTGICFDLLEIDGRDMRPFPLITRRVRLKALLRRAGGDVLQYSDAFPDPAALLQACDARGLEGIVSKRTDQAYVSGKNRSWVKVKCHSWRAAHAGRSALFRAKR